MKIRKHICENREIEVDIHLEDVFDHLQTLPAHIEYHWIADAILTAQGILRRIPDKSIEAMSTDRRRLIADALLEQAKRFEAVNATADLFDGLEKTKPGD